MVPDWQKGGHWICNVMRLFSAFEKGTVPLEYYADLSKTIYAVKTGLIMASIVSGDVIIVSACLIKAALAL
ncbi:hypothetical protein AAF712_009384 [Marasmius tenuissimus]|uniref:Uncharacterized protein n=1 Tax=Marasmius tenuissimus TaxID=585030 RepID=A0ABR2ZPU3_9AGAR